jgi:hypothetical protein
MLMLLMAASAPPQALHMLGQARAAPLTQATLFKNPQCTCCEGYAE